MRAILFTVIALALGGPSIAQARPPQQSPPEEQRTPTPFDQGRIRAALGMSTAGDSDNRYFVIGAGVGYYLVDGLELGLEYDTWLGGDPLINKLSPQLRYVFFQVPYLHPYIGTLYRHWFVGDGQDDIDTIGGRAGIFSVTGPGFFMGIGVVHEVIISACEDDCSETYPEFTASISF